MTITQAITALPDPPDPAVDTDTEYATNAAAFTLAMVTHATELETFRGQANTLAATLSAIASGAAVGIPYTFSTTTADADPGAGILRLDNATQNLATTIRADLAGSDGSTYTDVLATFDDSTSTVKGHILLQDIADATKWILFTVSALASPAGYKNLTVAVVAASAASPFADGAALVLKFSRTGDKGTTGDTGATGPSGALIFIDSKVAAASASLDFTTGINSTYDEYVLELVNVVLGTAGQNLLLRTSTDGGSTFDAAASDYFYAGNSWTSAGVSTVLSSAGAGLILVASNVTGTASHGGVSGSIRFYNPAGTASFKSFILDIQNGRSATAMDMFRLAACRAATADIDAVRIIANTGTIASGTVRLYGVSKT
jgi:hypothetical protein